MFAFSQQSMPKHGSSALIVVKMSSISRSTLENIGCPGSSEILDDVVAWLLLRGVDCLNSIKTVCLDNLEGASFRSSVSS